MAVFWICAFRFCCLVMALMWAWILVCFDLSWICILLCVVYICDLLLIVVSVFVSVTCRILGVNCFWVGVCYMLC